MSASLVALIAVTVVLAVSLAIAQAGGKSPFDPWAGLTDSQKQAQVDQTHAANVKYLQEFQAKHGDPHALPIIKVSTYQPEPQSLGAAVALATLVIHGRVTKVQFFADPNGGNLPSMTATVQVIRVGKGPHSATTVVVSQLGGPVAQPGGTGALVELEYGELILPGDEVLLLLTPTQNGFTPVYGAGVQFVRNDMFIGDPAARYGITAQPLAGIWSPIASSAFASDAYPLQPGE